MSVNREDYLKVIFELGGAKQSVSNKAISEVLGLSPASVTEMISKMAKDNMVTYTPYRGTKLSEEGILQGANLVRRHRLWEVFLVEHLDYSWNEVHDDAEVLEHVTSEQLADHLEDYLNHPMHCPHGGIIPKKEQVVHEERRQTLESYPVGSKVRIARVLDEKELLDYLVTIDLNIDEEYEIVDVAAYEGPITIQNQQKKIPVSFKAASTIFVDKL